MKTLKWEHRIGKLPLETAAPPTLHLYRHNEHIRILGKSYIHQMPCYTLPGSLKALWATRAENKKICTVLHKCLQFILLQALFAAQAWIQKRQHTHRNTVRFFPICISRLRLLSHRREVAPWFLSQVWITIFIWRALFVAGRRMAVLRFNPLHCGAVSN